MIAEIPRFAGVGLAATLVHLAVALLAQGPGQMPAQAANALGFGAALGLSYIGHRSLTFGVSGPHGVQFPRFALLALAGFAASGTITHVLHTVLGAPFALTMAAVALAVPPLSFVLARGWAFAAAAPGAARRDIGAALGLAAVFFVVFQGRTINHDTAYFLIATRQWLEGARLYADILEINPPLNFYYTAPALWLADATGLSATDGQYLLLAGLMAASLAWVWRILAAVPRLAAPRAAGLLVLLALAVSVPAAAHAGQREHLLVLFVLPWLVAHLALPAADAGRAGAARAAFAAAGICLKPHFLLYPLAMTLWRVAATRSLRPVLSVGNLTIAGIGASYLAAVALIHPAYFDTIVPLAREVYGGYGFGPAGVLRNLPAGVLALALLALLAARRQGLPRSGAAAAAVAAAAAIYLVQGKGFAYQALPVAALSAVACLWLLAGPHRPGRAAAGLALLCLGLIGAGAVREGFYRNWVAQTLAPEVTAAGPAPAVLLLSTHVWPSFPLVLATGARWTGRYPALWTLPGALNGLDGADCTATPTRCARLHAILDDTRGHVLDDLEAGRPDVLIVHRRPGYIRDPGFDLRRFLAADPRFEPFLAGYRKVRTVAGFDVWARASAALPERRDGARPRQP